MQRIEENEVIQEGAYNKYYKEIIYQMDNILNNEMKYYVLLFVFLIG